MAEVNNCLLPDDLQYHVEFNVWLRDNGDGTFDMGMTDIAQTMAGSVIHCRAKAVGKTVKKGKSIATVESGKWVGPVKTPLTLKSWHATRMLKQMPQSLIKAHTNRDG
tara:strand:- start:1140 stop:1463 length:324 start_codon:yes stop_codon:yes gene_type:complete